MLLINFDKTLLNTKHPMVDVRLLIMRAQQRENLIMKYHRHSKYPKKMQGTDQLHKNHNSQNWLLVRVVKVGRKTSAIGIVRLTNTCIGLNLSHWSTSQIFRRGVIYSSICSKIIYFSKVRIDLIDLMNTRQLMIGVN